MQTHWSAITALDEKVINTIHAIMPDYAKRESITFPYTATSDGYISVNGLSYGGSAILLIDGLQAFIVGQTISSTSYTEVRHITPIATGQTATINVGNAASISSTRYFIPCIGNSTSVETDSEY